MASRFLEKMLAGLGLIAIVLVLGTLFTRCAQAAEPEKQITVTMPIASWNVVLQGLGELQLKTAIPVLTDIQAQSAPQLAPPAPPPQKKEPKR